MSDPIIPELDDAFGVTAFRVSLWPVATIHLIALVGILGISLFFLITLESQGLTLAETQLIVSYFAGIGTLIAIGSVFLSWFSGPEIRLSSEGLTLKTSWLLDRTYPGKQEFYYTWGELRQVTAPQLVTFLFVMPYLKFPRNTQSDHALKTGYIPIFMRRKKGFIEALLDHLEPSHPLIQAMEKHS